MATENDALGRNFDEASGLKDRSDEQRWDRVVASHQPLFHLGIVELWHYRDLLLLFVRRDIVSFYKQTVLGPLWFFIQPLLTTAIYMLVFGKIAGLSTDGAPAILFYLSGVTLWNYFAECLTKTATVFRDNSALFGKVYFPRIIVPLSIVVSSLVRFGIQYSLFLLILLLYIAKGEVSPTGAVVLLPILVMLMALLGLATGMVFSALTTKYRDLVFLLSFGVQLLMYATPVVYPTSEVPDSVVQFLNWNPLTSIFESLRYAFLGVGTFSYWGLAYTALVSFLLLLFALVLFNRIQRTHMDTI